MAKTICVDFDGVLHKDSVPYGPIEKPLPGAIEFLNQALCKGYEVVILSCRCNYWNGKRQIRNWLKYWSGNLWYDAPGFPGIENVRITNKKPPAIVYIDDRAWRFEGVFPTMEQIKVFKSWNRK